MARIGITTTVPSEVIFAAGHVPVDLNNIFITDIQRSSYFETAEVDGFPRPLCGWIKGMYAACLDHKIGKVIAVTQGDCSNTHVLMEIYRMRGVETVPFNFPYGRDPGMMRRSIELLLEHFGVTESAAEEMRVRLNRIRAKLGQIDRMTWRDGVVTGFENHLLFSLLLRFRVRPRRVRNQNRQVHFRSRRARADGSACQARPYRDTADPRRFISVRRKSMARGLCTTKSSASLPCRLAAKRWPDQYLNYTYPYDIGPRIDDITEQITARSLDGIIHYVQSFCHRQMEDLIFRERIDVPILTIEGDSPRPVDARAKIRLESFIRMIAERKGVAV